MLSLVSIFAVGDSNFADDVGSRPDDVASEAGGLGVEAEIVVSKAFVLAAFASGNSVRHERDVVYG